MRNALAKMDVKLPELQKALERGDRTLLLTPVSEAFAEYNPNTAQPNAATSANNNNVTMNSNSHRKNNANQSDSNESSR